MSNVFSVTTQMEITEQYISVVLLAYEQAPRWAK